MLLLRSWKVLEKVLEIFVTQESGNHDTSMLNRHEHGFPKYAAIEDRLLS